jgi:hypothetical protein
MLCHVVWWKYAIVSEGKTVEMEAAVSLKMSLNFY